MYTESKRIIQDLKNQLFALNAYGMDLSLLNFKPNVEYKVSFDINEAIRRHEWYINRFIYHAENFINKLETFDASLFSSKGKIQTSFNDNSIFFDFDSFIITISALFEETFRQDAEQVLNSSNYNLFASNFPTKKDENSLIWRLTILRNRVVHPDNATYNETSSRYMEFSSKGMATIENGILVEIKANLIDIKNSKYLRNVLKYEIIDESQKLKKEYKTKKKNGESPCRPQLPDFHRIVFGKGKKPKREQSLLYVGGVNLIETFIDVLFDSVNNLKKVNSIFAKEYKNQLKTNFFPSRVFIKNKDNLFYAWNNEGKAKENQISQNFNEIFIN